jgi:TRAP transporter TAXI family solute receptor
VTASKASTAPVFSPVFLFDSPLRGALAVLAALVFVLLPIHAWAQPQNEDPTVPTLRFVQIGTGPLGGTYFPVGGMIANAISNPPGSQPCDRGGSCGIPGVIAVAQSTSGSVVNIAALAAGREDLALAQADLVYWAYHGDGPYKGTGAVDHLRAVAMLFQEKIHLVVRKDSGIHSPGDLKGKRVSLGDEGSGTRVDALLIIDAYGLKQKDLKLQTLRPGAAADAMRRGELDAFFFVAAPPVSALIGLAEDKTLALVPLDGPKANALVERYPFLAPAVIAQGTYPGVPETATLGVGALLISTSDVPDTLIYGVTRALLHPSSLDLFRRGHPAGKQITAKSATIGLGIPLHAGAARYYFDAGLMK